MMLSSGTLGNRRLRIVAEGVGYQECLVKNTQYFSRFILNSQFEKVFPIALGNSVLIFSLFSCFKVQVSPCFLHSVSRLYGPGYSEQSTEV